MCTDELYTIKPGMCIQKCKQGLIPPLKDFKRVYKCSRESIFKKKKHELMFVNNIYPENFHFRFCISPVFTTSKNINLIYVIVQSVE